MVAIDFDGHLLRITMGKPSRFYSLAVENPEVAVWWWILLFLGLFDLPFITFTSKDLTAT
jgi:hypothetical protein